MTRPTIEDRLHTTADQFDTLHRAQAKARSTSKSVTVDRQALINVLMDHSALVRTVGQQAMGGIEE